MRRILRKIAEDDYSNLSDTSTLADPIVTDPIIDTSTLADPIVTDPIIGVEKTNRVSE